MSDDRMNERVGAHRFEGPTGETIEISLFRNRITTRRGSGAEPKVKACPNVDDALKQWKRTLAQMHATMREVSLPIEGTRTVVVKSGRDTITLRVVGYDLFEDRTSMPGGPSPLFALSSHAEALEMLEDRVESFTRYGDKVLSDVSETSAKPEVNPVIPPLDLPEVKWSKNSVVVDLAEDSGRWSSLAAIVTELGKSERPRRPTRWCCAPIRSAIPIHSETPSARWALHRSRAGWKNSNSVSTTTAGCSGSVMSRRHGVGCPTSRTCRSTAAAERRSSAR